MTTCGQLLIVNKINKCVRYFWLSIRDDEECRDTGERRIFLFSLEMFQMEQGIPYCP